MMLFAKDVNSRHPLGCFLVPANTFEPAGRAVLLSFIAIVFARRANPYIFSSIIKPVTVAMIDLYSGVEHF